MGAYLSEPVIKKESCDKGNEKLSYGASEMQGWRVSMEDAHSSILNYDDDLSFFAVYDGHGGSEVATYTAKNLPNFIKTTDEYKDGDLKGCLINGFLGFDQCLLSDEVMTKLCELAGMNNTDTEDSELDSLAKEAEIPINDLLCKLKQGGYNVSSSADDKEDEESSEVTKKNNGETSKSADDVKGSNDEKENSDTSVEAKEQDEKDCQKKEKETTGLENTKEEKSEVGEEKKEEKEAVKEEEEEEELDDDDDDDDDTEIDDDDDDDDDEDADDEEEQTRWSNGDEVGYDSGTTAVVALLRKDRLVVGNVGDSRCVLCRNGAAIDMSVDHKPENDKEMTRIKNAGGRVTGEGRVNGGLNLSRALGDHRYKAKTDLRADEQQITAMPDIIETEITDADKFLVLACDGIWNVLSSQEVVDFVSERLGKQSETGKVLLSKICEELFDRCLASNTSGDGTGCDNMTAIIVLLTDLKDFIQKTKRKLSQEDSQDDADSSTKKSRTE